MCRVGTPPARWLICIGAADGVRPWPVRYLGVCVGRPTPTGRCGTPPRPDGAGASPTCRLLHLHFSSSRTDIAPTHGATSRGARRTASAWLEQTYSPGQYTMPRPTSQAQPVCLRLLTLRSASAVFGQAIIFASQLARCLSPSCLSPRVVFFTAAVWCVPPLSVLYTVGGRCWFCFHNINYFRSRLYLPQ